MTSSFFSIQSLKHVKTILMKTWLLLILFILSQSLFAVEDCAPLSDSTQTIIHCKRIVGDYPVPVHFFIPKNLDTTKSIKTLLHFHGHNLSGWDHFYHTSVHGEGYGDYGAFLEDSKINGVVAVPESFGNCKTYDEFFADQNRAEKFLSNLENLIKDQSKAESQLVLSGHSGAYRVLNRLAGFANKKNSSIENLVAIGLFDATYGSVANVSLWVKQKNESQDNFIFYDSFVTGARATAEEGSLNLRHELSSLNSDQIIFASIEQPKSVSTLDQHFGVLKRGSLTKFWTKVSEL